MDHEGLGAGLMPLEQLFLDVRFSGRREKGGIQSRPLTISVEYEPGLMFPGQRIRHGTRKAPSQFVFFSLREGVVPASGQEFWWGPLSVV